MAKPVGEQEIIVGFFDPDVPDTLVDAGDANNRAVRVNVVSQAPGAGGLTDVELRASPVPVEATIDTTGLATDAGQATGNVSLASIDAKLTNPLPVSGTVAISGAVDVTGSIISVSVLTTPVGQQNMANSMPVVLASNQAAIPVTNTNLDVALSTRLKPADTLAAVTAITNVVHVDDNAGSLTVDGTVAVTNVDVALSTRLKPADTLAAVTSITNVVHVDDNAGSLTVDGTVTTSPPANASTNVAQLAGTATSVNSGNKDAGTLRVVLATDQPALTNKLLVTPDSVALPANQSVNINQIAGVTPVLNTGVRAAGVLRVTVATDDLVPGNITQMGSVAIAMNTGVRSTGTQRVTIATDDLVPVSPPALTKGGQGATGFSTQDLKDAGRNQCNFFHAVPIITTVAEVMQTLTGYKSGAAVAATATPAVVTTAKIYRINSIIITYWAATVIGGARINLRANTGGVAIVSSPLVWSQQVGIPAVFTAGAAMTYTFPFPDGMEFAAGTGIAVGVIGEGAVPTTGTIVGYVMISIHGYEY